MNPRVTLGFVAALVVLAAVVLGLDRFNVGQPSGSGTPGTTGTATEQPTVFEFDDQKVTAFTVRFGDKTARFVKQGQDWKIDGSEDPANRVSLTSLLIRLSSLKASSRIPNPGDLSQFGLATPKMEATAELDDGTKYSLYLGDNTPVQTGTYAKTADSPDVYVVASQIAQDVQRLATDPKEPPTPTPRPSPTAAPSTPSPAPAGTPPANEGTPSPTPGG